LAHTGDTLTIEQLNAQVVALVNMEVAIMERTPGTASAAPGTWKWRIGVILPPAAAGRPYRIDFPVSHNSFAAMIGVETVQETQVREFPGPNEVGSILALSVVQAAYIVELNRKLAEMRKRETAQANPNWRLAAEVYDAYRQQQQPVDEEYDNNGVDDLTQALYDKITGDNTKKGGYLHEDGTVDTNGWKNWREFVEDRRDILHLMGELTTAYGPPNTPTRRDYFTRLRRVLEDAFDYPVWSERTRHGVRINNAFNDYRLAMLVPASKLQAAREELVQNREDDFGRQIHAWNRKNPVSNTARGGHARGGGRGGNGGRGGIGGGGGNRGGAGGGRGGRTNNCYECGQPGHTKADCPTKNGRGSQ